MLYVTEHQIDGVSGRGYREFQGDRYWFWESRGLYCCQTGGKQRLIHVEIYKAIHGEPAFRGTISPSDGNLCNTSPGNWTLTRSVKTLRRSHPVQEIDGIRFYWKPEGYYKADQRRHRGITMHRYIWERSNGQIPSGFHVHHRDGNKSNNAIENLELFSASDHSAHHSCENKWIGSEANVQQLDEARRAASEWHSSEAGREWHKQHGKECWSKREWKPVVCHECGTEFRTPWPTRAKYCHQNCRSQALRRRQGKSVGVRPDRRKAPLLSGKRRSGK